MVPPPRPAFWTRPYLDPSCDSASCLADAAQVWTIPLLLTAVGPIEQKFLASTTPALHSSMPVHSQHLSWLESSFRF